MAFKAYRRDSKGRFSGTGGQARQESRLKANERRTVQRGKDLPQIAAMAGRSTTVQSMAKKVARSAKVNAKARNVYKSKRIRGN